MMDKSGQIIKTQPGAPASQDTAPAPGTSKPVENDPKTVQLRRKKEKADIERTRADEALQKHQTQQEKYQTQMKKQEQLKARAAKVARSFFKRIAQPAEPATDPNKEPAKLFQQIKGTLNDLGLKSTMVWPRTTQIFLDKEKILGGQNLKMYRINLRDDAGIDKSTASDLNDDHLIEITEDKNDMVAFIWGPYTAPATPVTEGAPPAGTP